MKKKVVVVCTVVGFLGLLSAATGFAAEATKIKASQVEFTSFSECIYPSSPAFALGLIAAFTLMIARIMIIVATGCICCKRGSHQSNSISKTARFYCVVSWFTFPVSFFMLIGGAALNNHYSQENYYSGSYGCYVVAPGVFAGASVLSLVTVVFGILYYINFTSSMKKNAYDPSSRTAPAGIAIGQPQFT